MSSNIGKYSGITNHGKCSVEFREKDEFTKKTLVSISDYKSSLLGRILTVDNIKSI